jgi:hypothetical protein
MAAVSRHESSVRFVSGRAPSEKAIMMVLEGFDDYPVNRVQS